MKIEVIHTIKDEDTDTRVDDGLQIRLAGPHPVTSVREVVVHVVVCLLSCRRSSSFGLDAREVVCDVRGIRIWVC